MGDLIAHPDFSDPGVRGDERVDLSSHYQRLIVDIQELGIADLVSDEDQLLVPVAVDVAGRHVGDLIAGPHVADPGVRGDQRIDLSSHHGRWVVNIQVLIIVHSMPDEGNQGGPAATHRVFIRSHVEPGGQRPCVQVYIDVDVPICAGIDAGGSLSEMVVALRPDIVGGVCGCAAVVPVPGGYKERIYVDVP